MYSNTYNNILDKTSDENIYYNINIVQATDDTGVQTNVSIPTQATYSETRTSPILGVPSHYKMCVTRFTLDGSFIPICIMPIQQFPNTNNLLTPYSITLQLTDVMGNQLFVDQEFLLWQNFNVALDGGSGGLNFNPPFNALSAANPFPELIPFYYMYNYQNFIDMMNVAIFNSWTAIQAYCLSHAIPFLMMYPPQFQLNSNNIIELVVETTISQQYINIYFNSSLYDIIYSFVGNIKNYSDPNGLDFLLTIDNQGSNIYDQTGTAPSLYYLWHSKPPIKLNKILYIISQEFSTLWEISNVKSIVFVSNTPIKKELIPPVIYKFNNQNTSSINTGNSRPIIADFEFNADITRPFIRDKILYNSIGPNRYIDLLDDTPMYTFTINVFFSDLHNNLYPVYLGIDDTINIKILFVKNNFKPLK